MKKEKYKKGERPKAQPACPRADVINVIVFQFFDNGAKPGRGRSRHVIKMEIHCEGKLVLNRPYWKRSVSMLEPKLFFEWVDAQSFDDGVAGLYGSTRALMDSLALDDDTEWLKLGHVEDTRLRDRYPGQFVVAVKRKSGPLLCWLQHGDSQFAPEAMFYNKAWRPGSPARLFAGTYDPYGMYDKAKAIAAKEAAVEAPVAIEEAANDDLLSMLEAGMREAGI